MWDQVGNSEDRFSHNESHFKCMSCCNDTALCSPAGNCKISKKTAFYGTGMKLARNEEETHTSDFR